MIEAMALPGLGLALFVVGVQLGRWYERAALDNEPTYQIPVKAGDYTQSDTRYGTADPDKEPT